MQNDLAEMLGVAPDAGWAQLASALEQRRAGLEHRARDGDREAGQRLLRLRLAYLNWAYGCKSRPTVSSENSAC